MTVEIGFATTEDLPQLADPLDGLFTLEGDFRPDRDRVEIYRDITADPATVPRRQMAEDDESDETARRKNHNHALVALEPESQD